MPLLFDVAEIWVPPLNLRPNLFHPLRQLFSCLKQLLGPRVLDRLLHHPSLSRRLLALYQYQNGEVYLDHQQTCHCRCRHLQGGEPRRYCLPGLGCLREEGRHQHCRPQGAGLHSRRYHQLQVTWLPVLWLRQRTESWRAEVPLHVCLVGQQTHNDPVLSPHHRPLLAFFAACQTWL